MLFDHNKTNRWTTLVEAIDTEQLGRCDGCGACLSSCPTYSELGTEHDGPRGRIQIMRMVAEGRRPSDRVFRHLESCLGCRACETACPSDVAFGRLFEPFRIAMRESDTRLEERFDWFRRMVVAGLLPQADRMRKFLLPVRLMQQAGLYDAVEQLGLLGLVPGRLGRVVSLLPPSMKSAPKLPRFLPAIGRKRARVAFFVGCVADALFRSVHWATLRVLQQNGCDIFIPTEQGCCGAMHWHAGDSRGARRMADANLVAFELDRYDAIVVNHARCGAMMKEYGEHWRDGLQPHRERFAAKVKDVHEFLDGLGMVTPPVPVEAIATYHDDCHLAHGQGIMAAPRSLLVRIPGLELREMPESAMCCGSAGIYSLSEAAMSDRLADRKIRNIETTGAQIVLASDFGSLLQINREVRKRKLSLAVMHPMELLDLSYGGATESDE